MIYLDSAILDEAKIASQLGWVKGITTNSTLLAKSPLPPVESLQQLAALSPGELYYQLTVVDFQGMVKEGRKALEIISEKAVLKVPATAVGLQVVAH